MVTTRLRASRRKPSPSPIEFLTEKRWRMDWDQRMQTLTGTRVQPKLVVADLLADYNTNQVDRLYNTRVTHTPLNYCALRLHSG